MTIYILGVIIGLLLILMDILFIPGAILGIIGGCVIAVSIAKSYFVIGPFFALALLGATLFLVSLLIFIIVRFKLWKKIAHTQTTFGSSHSIVLDNLIGKEGKIVSALRPAGSVVIDNKRYDAVSEGIFLEKDLEVIVTGKSGAQIVVKIK